MSDERNEIDELLAMLIPDGDADGDGGSVPDPVGPPADIGSTGQQPAVSTDRTDEGGSASAGERPDPVGSSDGADDGGGRWRGLLLAAVGLVVLLLLGVGAWFLLTGDDNETTSGGPGDPATGTVSGADDPEGAADDGSGSLDGDTEGTEPGGTDAGDPDGGDREGGEAGEEEAAGTTTTTAPTEPLVAEPTPENPDGALAYGVYRDGKLYFRGVYPSQELADQLTTSDILGEDNTVFQGDVDPRATFDPDSFPIYLQDRILFESSSAELSEEFAEILDSALPFLLSRPDAVITVVARTDYEGGADENLELSRRRAQAVADYWVGRGADPAQISLDPRGEVDAVQDATPEQAAIDRRVELVVGGLTSGG